MLVVVLAAAFSLFFAFICSVCEAVLLSLKHSHIESMGQSRAGRILRQFKREIDIPIAAVLVLATTANVVGATVMGAAYTETFDEHTLLAFSLAFTLVL